MSTTTIVEDMDKTYPRRAVKVETAPTTPVTVPTHKLPKHNVPKQSRPVAPVVRKIAKPPHKTTLRDMRALLQRETKRFDTILQEALCEQEAVPDPIPVVAAATTGGEVDDEFWTLAMHDVGNMTFDRRILEHNDDDQHADMDDDRDEGDNINNNILVDIQYNHAPPTNEFNMREPEPMPEPLLLTQGEDLMSVFKQRLVATRGNHIPNDEFIHCDNDPNYGVKRMLRKQRTSLKENDNRISQRRPKGSATLCTALPDELQTCPCNCRLRNPSSDLDLYTTLSNFYEKGWLRDNEDLGLFFPGFVVPGTRNCPATVGKFQVETTGAHNYVFSFYDPATAIAHCCPISWFYSKYLDFVAEGLIPDIDAVSELMWEQISVNSNVYKFILVLDLNVTLTQMSINYRHDIGMHQHRLDNANNTSGTVTKKVRVPFKQHPADVQFKTRTELAEFFAPKARPIWKDMSSIWMREQTRRIKYLEQANDALRKALMAKSIRQ